MIRPFFIRLAIAAFVFVPHLGLAQVEKMQGAVDLYMPPAIQANHIKELTVTIQKPEQAGAFTLVRNQYNAQGQLLDSTDAQGDRHYFHYDGKQRLKEYVFTSNSFEYEKMTGEPEYRQSKQFTYNAKGKLTQLRYYQMDSLSHTIDFALDKKGRTLSYHSKDQFGEPTFMGYYTYTKFDSVATFKDYSRDSVLLLTIQYAYNKKKRPISRIEQSQESPTRSIWTFTQTPSGDSTFSSYREAGTNEDGLEIIRLSQQVLIRKMNKGKLAESSWSYGATEFPAAELDAQPQVKVLDRMTGYYENGKCLRMHIASDGEADKIGLVTYNDRGLISQIAIQDAATKELLFNVVYAYQFH